MACAVASVLALAGAQGTLAQSSNGYNKEELAALEIVHDTDEGWKAKSAAQIAAILLMRPVARGRRSWWRSGGTT
jgi:hypothetical protein